MNFYSFSNDDGSVRAIVNLDTIVYAEPAGQDKVTLHSEGCEIQVKMSEFEKASRQRGGDEFPNLINRLIQSLDRLTFRIPSSIKLHL